MFEKVLSLLRFVERKYLVLSMLTARRDVKILATPAIWA